MLESFLHGAEIIQDHHCLVQDRQTEDGPVLFGVPLEEELWLQASPDLPDNGRDGANDRETPGARWQVLRLPQEPSKSQKDK